MVTRVGDDCLFMVGVHVAHDCIIGDHVIMANNATLAGHVVDRRLRRVRRPLGGASVRAHRPACDGRRRHRRRARRHSLRLGAGRPRAALRPQHRRHAAARLLARRHPGVAHRLPDAVRRTERPARLPSARGPVGDALSAPMSRRPCRAEVDFISRSRPPNAACACRSPGPMAARLGILAGGGELPRRLIAPAARWRARSSCSPSRARPIPRWSPMCRTPGSGSARPARGCGCCARTAVEELVLAGGVPPAVARHAAAGLARRQILRPHRLQALGDDGLLSRGHPRTRGRGVPRRQRRRASSPHALAPDGALGAHRPDAEAAGRHRASASRVARALGALDIGQAVVVQQGLVLGVEAIEGTMR